MDIIELKQGQLIKHDEKLYEVGALKITHKRNGDELYFIELRSVIILRGVPHKINVKDLNKDKTKIGKAFSAYLKSFPPEKLHNR